jgi:hypothetical protein
VIGHESGFIIRVFLYNAESVVFQKKYFFRQLVRSIFQFKPVSVDSPRFGFLLPSRRRFYRPETLLYGPDATRFKLYERLGRRMYVGMGKRGLKRTNGEA